MKIAIASDGTDLKSRIADRFGRAPYLIIIDLDSGDYEAVPNPGAEAQRGGGMQTLTLILSKGAKAVVCGYCSPRAQRQLEENGIRVLSGLRGTVEAAIEEYRRSCPGKVDKADGEAGPEARFDKHTFLEAIRRSIRQLLNLLPILVGVVLLIGLFHTFISREMVTAVFSGNPTLDTLWGTCFGSILAGNPINSYVIGAELLRYDVSMFAVTALIIAWVTVGLVQLPAEIASLGAKFALVRNALCFVLTIPAALVTVLIVNLINGWIS